MLMIRPLNHAFRFRLGSDLDSKFQIKVLWVRRIEECKCVLVVIAELGNVCEQVMVKPKCINMLQFPWAEFYREIHF